ncbi:hydrogenase maturation nickel metallochaperone HypA [Aureitalea sp. L0-47]|uniref:hydrogenase maturation nickel metallochaperone HypA/HybF n=1 Tax=Aureitalea sp. L0-47 TaxID=2816962 RepID=UPI00223834CC|nr:hydrogenase maturation nickel metallochaperone HypA [Aureitalea sp. L0-47]MCW5519842.1 hydrogenase maturation nickel metallochaperone HypA [Aureitalea sp. L0-47]
MSVALGIVSIAEKELEKTNAKQVDLIELDIGDLAGIELDSLNFVWPTAVKNTVLENAKKKINIIKGRAKCVDCESEFELENFYDQCPKCESFSKTILFGKELRVKSLEIS